MKYDLASAQDYAKQGRTQEWVVNYLNCPEWANIPLRSLIEKQKPVLTEPREMELSHLICTTGPSKEFKYYEPPEVWNFRIDKILSTLEHPSQLPPLIVRIVGDVFSVHDGTHRIAAMKRMGWSKGWVLLWEDSDPRFRGKWE